MKKLLMLFSLLLHLSAHNVFADALPEYAKFRNIDDTGSKTVIDHAHHEIHEGCSYDFNDSISLNNTITQDYLIVTPEKGYVHYTRSIDFIYGAKIEIYEGSDKNGTTLQTNNVYNKNRISTNTPGVKIYKGTSGGSTDGTLRVTYQSGGGVGSGRFGGSVRENDERILKQNTKYLFRITSYADANLINVDFSWYENGFFYKGKI